MNTVLEQVTATSVAAELKDTAVRFDDSVALRMGEQTLTFAELGERSRRIACALQTVATESDAPIVVQVPMSIDSVTIVLGVFTACRPIVALDPELPSDRVTGILDELVRNDRRPALFITDRTHLADARSIGTAIDIDVLDSVEFQTAGDRYVGDVPDARSGADTVTSIQFTSGSTGTPKGVLHPNAMWLADSVFMRDCFEITPGTRVALCLPFSFGAGLNVLINSLLNGAEISVVDPRSAGVPAVLDAIATSMSDLMFMTPNLLRALLTHRDDGLLAERAWTALRRLITTGEALTGELATAALERAPQATVTNWVGSSETSALAYFDVRRSDSVAPGNLPAGRVAPGKSVTIDGDGHIVVTSPYLAQGYLDSMMNDGRFGRDASGVPTFRMGDRGSFDDGILCLGGRTDNAVKVRGYLVEPAEIEAALLADGDLREAIVVPITGASGATELAAYVVPTGTVRTPPTALLRYRLGKRLPQWMIPSHIVELGELPRTVRGKVDRAALEIPRRHIESTVGPTEAAIAGVWADVLGLDEVGRTENLYALGADSLTVQEILVTMTRQLSITLSQADAASAPTVAQMTALVSASTDSMRQADRVGLAPTTVTLRTAPGRPVFCFTGAGASALTFVPLASRIADTGVFGSVYAFAPHGLENRGVPDWTVAAAARRHLRDLRRLQPSGPYLLVGHSLGGFIALEVARRLRAADERVEQVVILDTFLPQRFARSAAVGAPGISITPPEKPLPRLELWRRRARIPFAGIVPMSPVNSARAMEEVGRRVGVFHRPKVYGGDVLLVQGTENHDDPRIWREMIVSGDLDVMHLDCDHMSVIRDPHIGDVVERMVARAGR